MIYKSVKGSGKPLPFTYGIRWRIIQIKAVKNSVNIVKSGISDAEFGDLLSFKQLFAELSLLNCASYIKLLKKFRRK